MSRGVRWTAVVGGMLAVLSSGVPLPVVASLLITAKTGVAPADLACPPDQLRTARPLAAETAQPPAAPVRIAFWGDSHTASGGFVDAAVREWGIGPASAQASFIAASFATKGVRQPLRSSCASPAWRPRLAYQRARGAKADFGLGLVAMDSQTQDAELAWDFRWPSMSTTVQSVDIHLGPREPGRSLLLAVSVDEGPEKIVALPSASTDVIQVRGDAPFSTLRLRLVAGQMVLAGLAPVYSRTSPAVVDVFSIPGATAEGWQGVTQEPASAYDLVVLEFGTNEAAAPAFNPQTYSESLRRSVARWRKLFPDARCVLITPPDRGPAQAGQKLSRRHSQVAVVQRVVSRSFGCELWDWQGWMRSAAAGALLQEDQTHLSVQGYEASGRAFAAAIPLRAR
jgi:lysophospholipase L1-like esterase